MHRSGLSLSYHGESIKSTFRERSRSPARGSSDLGGLEAVEPDESQMASSWWAEKHVARPWQDIPKRKRTVPPEHREALDSTRKVTDHRSVFAFICHLTDLLF